MTPYLETRRLPVGRRRALAMLVAALMVIPVGALLPGSEASGLLKAAAILALCVLAPLLGLGLGAAHQQLSVDAATGTITRRTTGELPDPRARVEAWPITSATIARLDDRGTVTHPSWGVAIEFADGPPLLLNAYADIDLAQDTVDHLVLLGLPGASRHAQRSAALAAPADGPER